jgi:hypothetical protein
MQVLFFIKQIYGEDEFDRAVKNHFCRIQVKNLGEQISDSGIEL